jgi:hypothetical protein
VGRASAEDGIDYIKDVKPLLRNKCSSCHGALRQEGELRLDAARFAIAAKVVVPGKPEESELIHRVTSSDDSIRMPAEGTALAAGEIEILRRWIAEGAPYPNDEPIPSRPKDHWAFQPVKRPLLPDVKDTNWARNPIDRFVRAKLESKGWQPNPAAKPNQLLRRVYLDVIGIPPTISEREAFLKDPNYEKLVDDLLSRTGYGERYARHWLDVARYADSNGYERDQAKPEVWRYRDYVIRSLNEDKPFDRMILEQIAGDELDDATSDTVIATGFHRVGPFDEEPADFAVDRYDQLDDILNTTCQAFLGLTMGCARCHDHKFDPLLQSDYYSMVAIFNPLKRPQEGRNDLSRRAAPPPLFEVLEKRDAKIAERQARIAKIRGEFTVTFLKGGQGLFTDEVRSALLAAPDKRTEEQKKLASDNQSTLDQAVSAALPKSSKEEIASHEKAIAQLRKETPDVPMGYFYFEPSPVAPETRLLKRGNPESPGDVVPPAVPKFLQTFEHEFLEPTKYTTRRRLSLARWMIHPENQDRKNTRLNPSHNS